ncbi:MAG: hypothetical protein F6K34_27695, partial [Okeania sp. SIO4D6]|nr:hypothetical protein [Okeania sp. SIO4D6]
MSNLDPEKEAKTVDKAMLKQIDSLKKEDERLYNILAIDVFASAQTSIAKILYNLSSSFLRESICFNIA